MIKKYSYLLRMQFYHLLGINRLLHTHDAKEKQRFVIVGVLGFIAVSILIGYTAKLSHSMAEAGLAEALPSMMLVICSLAALMLTFVKSTGVLIGLKDYDMVMSMPVNSLAIVMSRITMLYFINLLIGFIAMLPSGIVYSMYMHPDFSGYLFLLGTLLFSPLIPMMISLTLGVLIVAVSSRAKHKNLFSLLLSITGVLLIVFASAKTQTMDTAQITNIGAAVTDAVNQFYPPAKLVSKALLHHDWGSFFIFTGSSLAVGGAFVIVSAHFYQRLNTAMFSHRADKNYVMGRFKQTSPFMALYKKELSRLASCTIYALNSCIGIILLLVVAIMAVFLFTDTLKVQLERSGMMDIIRNVLPLALAVFVSMTSTTAPSLSLEGKNRWIMCSIPADAGTIYDAKIAVNLTVILPVLTISTFLLSIAFRLSAVQMILTFVTPAVYAFFISVLGIFLNIKFPKYDWTSEYYAVKGGAVSVLATIGTGMAGSMLPLYLSIFFSKYCVIIILCTTIMILAATVLVYQRICRTKIYAV